MDIDIVIKANQCSFNQAIITAQSLLHWQHEMIAILLDPSTRHSVFRACTSESRETLSMAVAATTCGQVCMAWFAHHHLVW
jgi:hypothetical protein